MCEVSLAFGNEPRRMMKTIRFGKHRSSHLQSEYAIMNNSLTDRLTD